MTQWIFLLSVAKIGSAAKIGFLGVFSTKKAKNRPKKGQKSIFQKNRDVYPSKIISGASGVDPWGSEIPKTATEAKKSTFSPKLGVGGYGYHRDQIGG